MEKRKKHAWLRFMSMVLKVGKWNLLLQMLLTVYCGVLPVLSAFLWQNILTGARAGGKDQGLYFINLAVVGGISYSYLYFSEIMDTLLRNRISLGMQKSIHDKAVTLPFDVYEDPELQDRITRAGAIFCYGDAVGFVVSLFGFFRQVITIVTIAVAVWSYHPLLTLSAMVFLVRGIVKLWMNKRNLDLELKLSPRRRETAVFQKYLTNRDYVKETRCSGGEPLFLAKWNEVTRDIIREEKKLNIRSTWLTMILDMMEQGVTILSYLFCIVLILMGHLDIAQFGALIVLTGQFLNNSSDLTAVIQGLHQDSISIKSAIEYFDLTEEKRKKTVNEITGISMRNAAYSYPGMERKAVKNISFSIKKGETIAVIGKNGSGKSTLAKLLLGLIQPSLGEVMTESRVMTESQLLSEISYESLYGLTTAVFQDFIRYALSVKDNILISGNGDSHDSEAVMKLLERLGITFTGEESGVDLHTELGVEYGGIELSGGQWQQLAIARGAFRNGDVVVLDEPTSALDPFREAELFETFQKLCEGKVGLIITHRLGLCAFADRIMVMEEGEIREYGTHEELLKKKGMYYGMFLAQQELFQGTIL